MKILVLTVGTRGDVQPFVALGKALKDAGYHVEIATHASFGPLIAASGLKHAPLNDDLVALTQSAQGRELIEGGEGFLAAVRRATRSAGLFADIYRRLLEEQWEAAQGADVIIYHPQAIGGYHLSEALGVPGIMADPLPTHIPTGEFPNLAMPALPLGAAYHRLTYRAIAAMTGGMFGKVVRRWREDTLKLPPGPSGFAGLTRRDGRPVPTLLSFSPGVIPPPADWPANVHVTGYWFLDAADAWEPPQALCEFLDAGPPPVYIGFGSMAARKMEKTSRLVLEALELSGQRGVVAAGWGGLTANGGSDQVFELKEAPHDWLFPRMAAVVHHGGSGTTAAGLRAGRPTVICPFVADQPMWGRRVAALGAGPAPIPQRKLTAAKLAAAIRQATGEPTIQLRAEALGAQIRAEDGLGTAVRLIEQSVAAFRASGTATL